MPAQSGSDRRGSSNEAEPPGSAAEGLLPLQRRAGLRQHHSERPLAQEAADHPSR